MRATARAAILFMALGVPTACLNDAVTGTRPLSLAMTASDTTTVVDAEVTFDFAATGTGLQFVWIDYGDGVADTLLLGGNIVEAAGNLTHSFDVAGSFVVSGRAVDITGTETRVITIEVN